MSACRPVARAALLAVLLAILASGCARTPPSRYYVLAAPALETGALPRRGPPIGLGPIRLPGYLDRPQIVTRVTGTRLDLSNRHRWAEPLAESFARALLANLMQALPAAEFVIYPWHGPQAPTRQVAIDVLRFDCTADGTLTLGARWSVGRGGPAASAPVQRASDIHISVTREADDYDALVTAASTAVGALAREIAAELQVD